MWLSVILLVFVLCFCCVEGRPISLLEQGWELPHATAAHDGGDERTLSSEEIQSQPLRVLFDTTELDVDTWNSQPQLRDTINELKETIIPSIESLIYETLSVVRRGDDIISQSLNGNTGSWKYKLAEDTCFGLLKNVDLSHKSNNNGGYVMDMEQHDLIVFVLGNSSNDPLLQCEASTYAMSAPCLLHPRTDRPLVGFVSLCLDNLSSSAIHTNDKNINENRLEHTFLHEITHNLGFNSEMFKYYRDPTTGQPLVQRPFIFANQINCVQERTLRNVALPTGVMEPVFFDDNSQRLKAFQMNTPTVQQIVKTQFDCPEATGALLENEPTNTADCFGSHWDERYHLYNSMSSMYDQESYFTPLTLALMEDSGWYRANYNHPKVKISPFGLNAGCDFLQKTCLATTTNTNTDMPSHCKGYFCNQLYDSNPNTGWQCDANHSARGKCDLFPNTSNYNNDNNNFLSTSNVGPRYTSADHCPLVRMDLTDCRLPSNSDYSASKQKEVFGPTSSCIEVQKKNNNNDPSSSSSSAICTTTVCNVQQRTVDVTIAGTTTVSCEYDFQQIPISQHGYYDMLTCPRIASICPELMTCPGQCSGKGSCDRKTLKCNCFDKSDTTEGCYNSSPLQYTKSIPESWNKLANMPAYQKRSTSDTTPTINNFILFNPILISIVVVLLSSSISILM